MKLIKRCITMMLVLAMFGNINVITMAKDKNIILEQAPEYYSKEHLNEMKKNNIKIDKYIKENYSNEKLDEISIKSGANKNLTVPLYQQEKDYYCGPASAKMLLKYVKGTLYTQASLATAMGTTRSNGTLVYKLTNTLNSKLGSSEYEYVLDSDYEFGNSLIYCIDKSKPIVCHVDTSALPIYNGTSCGHYIVSIGYSWYASGSSGYSKVKYNDPNWNNAYFGTYTCDVDEMRDAINLKAGYYIRAK